MQQTHSYDGQKRNERCGDHRRETTHVHAAVRTGTQPRSAGLVADDPRQSGSHGSRTQPIARVGCRIADAAPDALPLLGMSRAGRVCVLAGPERD